MENILDNLNNEQREAVQTVKGPLLVLAGAGSGKTKLLTSRIAYLIKGQADDEGLYKFTGVRPRDILAVTFTNKAAKEMKERLGKILGEDVVKYMWVGTFHGICGRMLRENIEKYSFQSGKKLDKNFSIYDETDSIAVIKQAIKKLNLDDKVYQPKLVKSVISNAKNKMQDAYTFATFARDFKSQKIASIFEEYENSLNNNNAIDFDDMLITATTIVKEKGLKKKIKYIIIDEYQDTSFIRFNLIKEIINKTHAKLMVVGDDFQSIYKFTGCDVSLFLDFKNYFKEAKNYDSKSGLWEVSLKGRLNEKSFINFVDNFEDLQEMFKPFKKLFMGEYDSFKIICSCVFNVFKNSDAACQA